MAKFQLLRTVDRTINAKIMFKIQLLGDQLVILLPQYPVAQAVNRITMTHMMINFQLLRAVDRTINAKIMFKIQLLRDQVILLPRYPVAKAVDRIVIAHMTAKFQLLGGRVILPRYRIARMVDNAVVVPLPAKFQLLRDPPARSLSKILVMLLVLDEFQLLIEQIQLLTDLKKIKEFVALLSQVRIYEFSDYLI
jgi:hypothetical protein